MRFRRFETRLLVSFLLLAAIPLLLLTLFAAGVGRVGIERIASPVLGESFDNAAHLGRALRERLQSDARNLLADLPETAPTTDREAAIRARLVASGFSLAAWELESGSTYTISVRADPGAGQPDARDWARRHDGRFPPEHRDSYLRFFGEELGPALRLGRAVGYELDPDLAAALEGSSRFYPSAQQLSARFAPVLRTALGLGLGLTFLVTALGAFLLARGTARRVSRPVRELARSADRLAAGDLGHRADVRAEGEVGALVRAFNRMGERLQESQAQLVQAERVAAWREVAQRVAHEIKNPLTPMRLAAHRLRKRVPEDDTARDCVESIEEEIDSLARLAGDFAEFAKLPSAELAPIDLGSVVAAVVELFRENEAGVRVTLAGAESLTVPADRDLLRQALVNLVKNATEALAGRGGEVTVRLEDGEHAVRVHVEDDGPGVPADLQRTLFRPGVSGRPGGSGLGLSIVQRIAEEHGGTLRYEDRSPGSRFVLSLPRG